MNVGSAFNGGGVAGFGYDTANASEIQVTVSGGLGESDRGGPAFNMIPKTGGNTFSGAGFWSTAASGRRAATSTIGLRSYGFIAPGRRSSGTGTPTSRWAAPSCGTVSGTIGNARTYGSHTDVLNAFANANAGNAAVWDYVQDQSIKSRNVAGKKIGAIRLTGQATPKNKLTFYYDYQQVCNGSAFEKGGEQCRDRGDDWVGLGTATAAPETGNVWDDRRDRTGGLDVHGYQQAPARGRSVLVQQSLGRVHSGWRRQRPDSGHRTEHAGGCARAELPDPAASCRRPRTISSTTSGGRRPPMSPALTA